MAFAQILPELSPQMITRMEQTVAIYNNKIIDIENKIANLNRYMNLCESMIPQAREHDAFLIAEAAAIAGGR